MPDDTQKPSGPYQSQPIPIPQSDTPNTPTNHPPINSLRDKDSQTKRLDAKRNMENHYHRNNLEKARDQESTLAPSRS